jgi:hypothetical protein
MPFFKCIFKDLLTNLNVRFWFFSKRDSWKPPTYQTKLTSFEKNCHNLHERVGVFLARRSVQHLVKLVYHCIQWKLNVSVYMPVAMPRLIVFPVPLWRVDMSLHISKRLLFSVNVRFSLFLFLFVFVFFYFFFVYVKYWDIYITIANFLFLGSFFMGFKVYFLF